MEKVIFEDDTQKIINNLVLFFRLPSQVIRKWSIDQTMENYYIIKYKNTKEKEKLDIEDLD